MIEENARLRDVLILQDALDQRMAGKIDSTDPLDQPGSALAFVYILNASLPERYRVPDLNIILHMNRYAKWSKRKLLKEVYRAWRTLGRRVPRGRTLPPPRIVKQKTDEIVDYLTSGCDEDIERLRALPLHILIDTMGIARQKRRDEQI